MESALFLVPKTDRVSLVSAEDRGGVAIDPDGQRARLVVADGASTAHRSGLLAELIVASFLGEGSERPHLTAGDNRSYERWHRDISQRWRERAEQQTGSQWYAQTNLKRGSAAAFAAAAVDGSSGWCVAVGDCCLFQIRTEPEPMCVGCFPVRSWRDFDSTPSLFLTNPEDSIAWPRWSHLQVAPGDVLVGTSDGMAPWLLAAGCQNSEVWEFLVHMTAEEFDGVVAAERALGTMVDDDTIVVRLTLGVGE